MDIRSYNLTINIEKHSPGKLKQYYTAEMHFKTVTSFTTERTSWWKHICSSGFSETEFYGGRVHV